MSAVHAVAGSQRMPGVAGHDFGRRDVLRGRLDGASGATVAVEIGGALPRSGRWTVRGERYVVEWDTPAPVPPGMGRVRVNLPTGVHRFGAWICPLGDSSAEVLPHVLVDVQERRGAVRVPVDLPGRLSAPGGAWMAAVRVRDLSVTGAGLGGDPRLSPGMPCALRVDGELGARLGALPGELVWCQPAQPEGFRYGMRFTAESDRPDHIYAWLSDLRRTDGVAHTH